MNKRISARYWLKDLLVYIWGYQRPALAQKTLNRWCEVARQDVHPELVTFAGRFERYAQLRRRRVPHLRAAVAAGTKSGIWRMARHAAVQQALPNAFFNSIGLPRLPTSLTTAQPN